MCQDTITAGLKGDGRRKESSICIILNRQRQCMRGREGNKKEMRRVTVTEAFITGFLYCSLAKTAVV